LLFSNLFSIARWIPDAPKESAWVSEILKKFSGAFLAPTQFPSIRERALAALIASRDPNAVFVLRQGIRSANPVIRRLACVGLGAIAQADAINDLRPMLVDDDAEVHLAAGLALGAIGTEEALKAMVQGLIEGEDVLKQAVAEALASLPGEGHNILKDAVEFEDIKVRRAAVFGLARIPAGWALVTLYRAMLEDAEWYVRAAAQVAFTQARDPDRAGLHAFPPLQELPWLTEFAATMGEAVPEGDRALQLLVRILQQAPPLQRVKAAQTLAKLGRMGAAKPLYAALTDQEEPVRVAAYQALSELQVQATLPLPGLI
jgi:HEAT repeat protein